MSKVHLTRNPKGEMHGWWCKRDPIKPPERWVTDKYVFVQYQPKDRCSRCGLYRDLDEFKRSRKVKDG